MRVGVGMLRGRWRMGLKRRDSEFSLRLGIFCCIGYCITLSGIDYHIVSNERFCH